MEPVTKEPEIRRAATVNAHADVVYAFLRDPGQLALLAKDVADVEVSPEGLLRLRKRGLLGAEHAIALRRVEERPMELVRWATPDGASLPAEIRFELRPSPSTKGTEIRVGLVIEPPGGRLTKAMLEMLGDVPGALAQAALFRTKNLIEAGEIPTLSANPAARAHERD